MKKAAPSKPVGKPIGNSHSSTSSNSSKTTGISSQSQGRGNTKADDKQHLSPNFNKKSQFENPDEDRPIVKGAGFIDDVPEYDENDLEECPAGCGRRFNPVALQKHAKLCKKVFQTKRKTFESQAQREIVDENEGLAVKYAPPKKQNSKIAAKPAQSKPGADNRAINGKKDKQKWKKQSEAFRAIIKQAKGGNISASEQRAMDQASREEQNLLTLCEYCGRRFNEKAAERHIPFCATKVKQNQIKHTSKKMPTSNRKYSPFYFSFIFLICLS